MNKRTVLLGLAALAAAGGASARARSMAVDGYAALVNQRVILVSEVLALAYPLQQQIRQAYVGSDLDKQLEEARRNALDILIERALMVAEFERLGQTLPDRAVEVHANNWISERFGNNRMEFLEALAAEGLTLAEWREQARDNLISIIMRRREIPERVVIAPQMIRAYYQTHRDRYRLPEQVHLRLIMLHAGGTAEERAVKRAQAEQIRERLLAGEDFGAVARDVSEGPKAAQGGDLGWMAPDTLQEAIRAAIAELDAGEVSPVIETTNEFYLVRVEGRKKESVTPFEEVRADIEKLLQKQEQERLYAAWIKRLRNRFYVRVF